MQSTALFFAVVLVLAAVHTVPALDQKLYGINYTPRKGQDFMSLKRRCKNATEVERDMRQLGEITDRIRIYSLTDCNTAELVLPAVQKAGLDVWVGLWVGPNNTVYAQEKAEFANLVKRGLVNNATLGVHVASEAIYRKDINVSTAIANMNEIKEILHAADIYIPITITDIADTYIQYPQLVKAVDIVSANSFPFWELAVVETAAQKMYNRMYPLMLSAKKYGKHILISETGWATNGSSPGASIATAYTGVTWLNDFVNLAKTVNWNYYWYTSYDTPWRHVDGDNKTAEVENYFGLYFANNTLKPEFAQLNFTQRVPIVTKMPPQKLANTSSPTTALPVSTTAIPAMQSATPAPSTAVPTTAAPTTAAPTTEALTTAAPTTEAPTTAAPTTAAPTTAAPTTDAPTAAPTTEAPTTAAPTTAAPTTEAPTTQAATTIVPATEAPIAEAPITEAPITTTLAPTSAPETNPPPHTLSPEKRKKYKVVSILEVLMRGTVRGWLF